MKVFTQDLVNGLHLISKDEVLFYSPLKLSELTTLVTFNRGFIQFPLCSGADMCKDTGQSNYSRSLRVLESMRPDIIKFSLNFLKCCLEVWNLPTYPLIVFKIHIRIQES